MTYWDDIFEKRPDLEPPGYREAAEKVAKRWAERPQGRKVRRGNRKKPKWPSAKHGSD